MIYRDAHDDAFAEAVTFFPSSDPLFWGRTSTSTICSRVKEAVNIPVIASLNGTTPGAGCPMGG